MRRRDRESASQGQRSKPRGAPRRSLRTGGYRLPRARRLASTTAAATEAETRARLLAIATQLFADRGFKDVTVRDICRDARANLASVNYHFRDKLGLYRAVLQAAIDRMHETTDLAREAGQGQPAETQLRTFISIFIGRLMADRSGTVQRLVTREMMDPTPALDAIVEQGVRPRMEYLSRLIAEMIGCERDDPRVLRSVASLSTQFAAYMPNPIADRLGAVRASTSADTDDIARHISDFSIAGIRAIARHGPRMNTDHG